MGRQTLVSLPDPSTSGRCLLSELSEVRRTEAMVRFDAIRPVLEGGVSLATCAAAAGVPLRTAQRWLAAYHRDGLAGLVRALRSDAGRRHVPPQIVDLIEGLALRKPRLSVASIYRQMITIADRRDWPVPSYATVHAIVRGLDPAMMTLAHDGHAA